MNIEKANNIVSTSFGCIQTACRNTRYDIENMNIWEWWSGVGLYGVIRAHENLNEDCFRVFLEDWLEKNLGNRMYGSVNRVIPCCAAEYIGHVLETQKYKSICDEYAKWLTDEALRTQNKGLSHVWGPGKDGKELGPPGLEEQLWADTMFMALLFVLRYGVDCGNQKLLCELIEQTQIHIDCLYSEQDKLAYHGFDCKKNIKIGEKWGRGNGWIAVFLAELIRYDINGIPDYVTEVFCGMLRRAYELQSSNGMLHTVIDRDDTYLESTASMLFGYAALAGYGKGLLDEKYFIWAETILDNLEFNENGSVLYASGGTDPSDMDTYANIPFKEAAYSHGIVMMFFSEYIKLKKELGKNNDKN